MEIVADTNIFLAVALSEPQRERIIALAEGATVIAPEILPYEIGNALSAMVKRGRLTLEQAVGAEGSASRIPARLVAVDVGDSLRLALENEIYAYDAYFLHCAKVSRNPLLTLDRRMAHVAERIGLEILEL